MAECVFCGKEIPRGTGTLFVRRDGTLQFYCSGKCIKNAEKLGRRAASLKWTAAFHAAKETAAGSGKAKAEKAAEEKPVEKEGKKVKRAERKAKKKAKKEKRKIKAKEKKAKSGR